MFAMRAEYFGRKYYATIAGFMGMAMLVGNVSGPVLTGLIRDTTESYSGAFVLLACLALLSVLLIIRARPPRPHYAVVADAKAL
jgi:MFS family permease